MVHLFRRFQQPVLIVITVIIIISFAWLYNTTQFDRPAGVAVATIYGRKVSQNDFRRELRRFEICRELQLIEMLEGLAGRDALMAMFMQRGLSERAVEDFIWNGMVLEHEAGRLGIEPTEAEIDAAVKAMPRFQTNGSFDPAKFTRFIDEEIKPRGFHGEEVEDVVRDDLRLRKVKDLLGSTIEATPAEIRDMFALRSQKTEASVIRLKLDDFKASAQATDEEAQKLFEQRKDTLKSDEQRRVKFAAFTLENQEKPLAGKERNEAMEKLSNQVGDLAVAMTDKSAKFDEQAAKLGAKVGETPAFPMSDPPTELAESEEAARAAFALTKEQPNSDPIITDNGYYLLQLAEVIESRPMTFEEAKPKLLEQIKQEKATEAMNLKATEIRNKLDAAIKTGKSLADAAKEAGVTAEAVPAFSRMEPPRSLPDAQAFMKQLFEMKEGALSEFIPTAGGGVIVRVDKRQPVDEAEFEKQKNQIVEGVAQMKREALFQEWLKTRRNEAKIQQGRG